MQKLLYLTFADKIDGDRNNGIIVTSLWNEENKELLIGYVENDFEYSVFLRIVNKKLYKKSQSEKKTETDKEGDF